MLKDRNRAREQAFKVRIHANPLFDDRDSSYLKSFSEAYGRSDILNNIISDIDDYVQSDDTLMVWVLAIRGTAGSGKSLFARRLILEVSESEKNIFAPLQEEFPSLHFEYFVCTCNVNNKMSFLGIWRPFIQHLLSLFSAQTRQAKDYIVIN
jgi:Cdc6-like AAA superfamily ATPase